MFTCFIAGSPLNVGILSDVLRKLFSDEKLVLWLKPNMEYQEPGFWLTHQVVQLRNPI
jgi:hypothetical protein